MNVFTLILPIFSALTNKLLENSKLKTLLNEHKRFKVILQYLICVVLILLVLSFMIILILPLIVFKFLLSLYLRIKYGENFGGFLNGLSSAFALQKEQVLIMSICFIDYDDRLEEFYEGLKNGMEKTIKDFNQLRSSVELKFGYYYFVKNQVNFEEIFSKITLNKEKKTLAVEDVLDYLDEMRSYDHKKLFEIIFLNQPVWVNNKKNYAFLFKANHSLLDGVSLLTVMFKHICKNKEINTLSIDTSKFVKSFKFDDCYFYKNPFVFEIHQFLKNDKQYSAYFIEDQPEFKSKIKFITKKLGVKYSQVIIAGLSYGISNILNKNNIKIENIQFGINVFSDMKQIQDMMKGKSETNTVTNSYLTHYVVLPKWENQTPREFVLEVANECEKVTKSVNALVLTLVSKMLSILPVSLWKEFFIRHNDINSFIFSNMLEHQAKVILGRTVTGFYTVVSNVSKKNMFFSLGCINGRIIINISARYDFIRSRDDLQFILDETFKYINNVFQELIEEKLKFS